MNGADLSLDQSQLYRLRAGSRWNLPSDRVQYWGEMSIAQQRVVNWQFGSDNQDAYLYYFQGGMAFRRAIDDMAHDKWGTK